MKGLRLKVESGKQKAKSRRFNVTGGPVFAPRFPLLALSVLLVYSSCKFNPNVQGKGTAYLQGVWKEGEVAYRDQLLQYTAHEFTFTCDSFYAVLNTRSTVNQYADSCFKGGRWDEYARGTYEMRKDTLFINATFTHSNFRQKLTGCYRIGRYLPVFIVKKHTEDSLVVQNIQEHNVLTLSLKKKLVCHPKPL